MADQTSRSGDKEHLHAVFYAWSRSLPYLCLSLFKLETIMPMAAQYLVTNADFKQPASLPSGALCFPEPPRNPMVWRRSQRG
jgi:hypothetical protein